MGTVDKNGRLVRGMKGTGKMIRLMVLVDFIMLMEIFTKEGG